MNSTMPTNWNITIADRSIFFHDCSMDLANRKLENRKLENKRLE